MFHFYDPSYHPSYNVSYFLMWTWTTLFACTTATRQLSATIHLSRQIMTDAGVCLWRCVLTCFNIFATGFDVVQRRRFPAKPPPTSALSPNATPKAKDIWCLSNEELKGLQLPISKYCLNSVIKTLGKSNSRFCYYSVNNVIIVRQKCSH